MGSLRTFKDEREIELIRKATDATIAAHMAAMRTIKPQVTEREISALLQYEWGKRGCERPSYAPIVGSGFNSTVLHYSEDSATIQAGDVIVIDAAGEYSMYATDITRTYPANGKFTARQREIYDVILGAQQAAIAAFASGKSSLRREDPNGLFKVAYDYINTHGKDLHGDSLGKYFIHGLGHYVGLGVHDPGTIQPRWARARYSPSSRAFTSRRKNWACASKTRCMSMRMANWSTWEQVCLTPPTR